MRKYLKHNKKFIRLSDLKNIFKDASLSSRLLNKAGHTTCLYSTRSIKIFMTGCWNSHYEQHSPVIGYPQSQPPRKETLCVNVTA